MSEERKAVRQKIVTFGDSATKDIFKLEDPKGSKAARNKIHHEQLENAQQILDDLNACDHPKNLTQHRPHSMEGHEHWWILDINDQYGVIFGWLDGKAYEVEACDYHETKFGPA